MQWDVKRESGQIHPSKFEKKACSQFIYLYLSIYILSILTVRGVANL